MSGPRPGRRGQRLARAGAPRLAASRRTSGRAAGEPRAQPAGPASWAPPGWDRPPAPPPRPAPGPAGRGRAGAGRLPGAERRSAYETDLVGAQGWALQHGWTISDGEGPQDAVLAGPARRPRRCGPARRPGRPACCAAVRARWSWSRSTSPTRSGRSVVAEVRGDGGAAARRRRRRCGCPRPASGGTAPAGSSRCPAATTRSTPAGCCSPPRTVRRCAGWCRTRPCRACCSAPTTATSSGPAPGISPAIRPDGHRPLLIEHHARLLTALVGALALGSD